MNQHLHHSSDGKLPSLNGLRVLLVEDTWIIAQSYAGLLEPLGVDVIGPAVNIAEAYRLMNEGGVHAALVDMNLQGELAYDLIDKLVQLQVPVVVVTGYEVLPRLENKTVAILKKPIRAEQLLRTLRMIAATCGTAAAPVGAGAMQPQA